MIPRATTEEHLADFARATTTEQSEHLRQAHSESFVDVFAGERRVAHRHLHRGIPNPQAAHRL